MAYSTITKPSLYFNTKLYTGTGSQSSITGVGFQPDWLWIKERNGTSSHQIMDAVRLYNNRIESDNTSAQLDAGQTGATYQNLTSFDSDGFSVKNGDAVNKNNSTYAAWNWKANGQGSSNTDGSINTTYTSANTTAGFSISSYTGTGANATVGHGLGVAPKMVIIKNLSDASNWNVYTTVIDGSMDYLYLNTTAAKADSSASVPTSSLLNLTSSNDVNGSSDNMIAYCFAEKKGYSKFGSYQGNGQAHGVFVNTGFKPAFIIVKGYTNTESWILWDNKRGNQGSKANPQDLRLLPNATNVEADADIDFLSNGFILRATGAAWNGNGVDYVFMAFAEEPLVANVGASIPATAR